MASSKGSNRVLMYVGIAVLVAVVIAGIIFVPKVIGFVQDNLMRRPSGDKNQTDDDDDETNNPPVADLTSNRTVYKVGDFIYLDGNKSYDPDAPKEQSNRGIFSYLWDFGDGTTPESTVNGSIVQTYSEAGIYTITMTVFDEDGMSDSDNFTVKVVPQDEVISTESAILLADPLLGLMPNSTNINWTIKDDAKTMNLIISLTGANIRETQSSKLELILFDPYERIVKNQTVSVVLAQQVNWDFFAEEISVAGEYDLRIRCLGGMALISVQGMVAYL
jgi:hypothetical protein